MGSPMQIIRYADGGTARLAVRGADGIRPLPVRTVAELLTMPLARIREVVEAAAVAEQVVPDDQPRLLPPVDGLTEVWASGVTYRRSSEARQEESQVADVYARAYGAARPELFFKSPAWRVCGPDEPVGVRPDSPVNVPEPELALVCNADAEIVGLSICDDVSSRSIEGENPLYLPQAKVYSGSCSFGPGIVPVWAVPDAGALGISVAVRRAGAIVWQGETSTALIHRGLDELVEHLYRYAVFPHGAVLSTGTGLVPELTFSLAPGDEVRVDIDRLGTLRNPVREATADEFGWLTPDPVRGPR
jgi:2-dehydro-3-deoxy-D-arabinonate dehydratase